MSEKSEKAEKAKDALKITDQSRDRNGMVYDLKADGNRLIVRISPRENPNDANEWRIDASVSSAPESTVVTRWGATKSDALRDVGEVWVSVAAEQGLPTFDWKAVAEALSAVRAI